MPTAAGHGFRQRSRGGSLSSGSPGEVVTVGHPRGDIEWHTAWGDPGSAYRFSSKSVSGPGLVIDSFYAGTGVVASRGRSVTRRSRSDWLMLLAPIAGPVEMTWQRRESRLRPGQFGLVSTTEPVQFRVPKKAQTLVFYLPRELMDGLAAGAGGTLGRTLPANPAFGLLMQHLRLTVQQGRSLDGPGREAAIRAAAELLTAALTSADPEAADCHGAVRIAQLRDYIDESLAAPSLSVAQVAAANFVSERTVQRLFSPTGETPAAYIRRRRLERCRADIVANPWLPIAEISLRWGLPDGSHLARQFRAQFGTSPQQIRAQADDPRPWPAAVARGRGPAAVAPRA